MPGPSTLETIGAPSTSKIATPPPPTAAETQSQYAQQLADVPEFADYGPVLNSSSKPAQLTESETEYQVSCVKHVFKEHIVFQVNNSPPCAVPDVATHGVIRSSMYQTPFPIQCSSRSLSSCSLRRSRVSRRTSSCPFQACQDQRLPRLSTRPSRATHQKSTRSRPSSAFSNLSARRWTRRRVSRKQRGTRTSTSWRTRSCLRQTT